MKHNGLKVLVAYFSATGETRRAAEKVASVTGADLYEIAPETPYTAADLDWNDRGSRSSAEMRDPASRPAIKGSCAGIGLYGTVFIGFPIWWYTFPAIVNTFIESHNLSGKTLVPFATSGGSAIGRACKDLKESYPGYDWTEGMLLNRCPEQELRKWAEKVLK